MLVNLNCFVSLLIRVTITINKLTIFKALSDALIRRLDLILGEETANAGTDAIDPTLLIT